MKEAFPDCSEEDLNLHAVASTRPCPVAGATLHTRGDEDRHERKEQSHNDVAGDRPISLQPLAIWTVRIKLVTA